MNELKKKYPVDFISYPYLSEEFGSCDHELLTDRIYRVGI